MKRIKLTQGKYALVDNEDYERVNKYNWCVSHSWGAWRAERNIRKPNGQYTMQWSLSDVFSKRVMKLNTIIHGDALTELKKFDDACIDTCITSPPYWGLRDYGVDDQLGLEPTFEEYITKLCDIFDEVKRVLKDTGTCWVNIGDTYSATRWSDTPSTTGISKKHCDIVLEKKTDLPDKCLCGIPFRFALEMINRGWILRNTLIWYKPNCMPSSAKDRFTVDFEYLFFFVKNKKYWFEQQFEEHTSPITNKICGRKGTDVQQSQGDPEGKHAYGKLGRNKRCVWRIPTQSFSEAHFAVFPEALIETPIKAGCPQYICKKCGVAREKIYQESKINTRPGLNTGTAKSGKDNDPNQALHNSELSKYRQQIQRDEIGYTDCGCNSGWRSGVCLDPFMGAGTTAVVARKLGRDFIGIELNKEYIPMAHKRIMAVPESLFKEA